VDLVKEAVVDDDPAVAGNGGREAPAAGRECDPVGG
jgi:hypothetical protein